MLETTNHSTLRAPCSWAPGFSKIDFGESMNSCQEKPLAGHAAKELKPNPCHPWDLTILMGKLVYSTNLPYSYICSTILSCVAAPRKIRNLFPVQSGLWTGRSLTCAFKPWMIWTVLLARKLSLWLAQVPSHNIPPGVEVQIQHNTIPKNNHALHIITIKMDGMNYQNMVCWLLPY